MIVFKQNNDYSSIRYEIDSDIGLTSLIEHFEYFIKACGYEISGKTLELLDNDFKEKEE